MALIISKRSEEQRLQRQYDKCTRWLQAVNAAPDDLLKLYNLHVGLWRDGLQNENLGPDSYGMFRTKDVSRMYSWEVYLGGVDGLFTHSVDEWERIKERDMASQQAEGKRPEVPQEYVRVCRQYRNHLSSNVKDIRNHVFDKGVSRDVLARNVMEAQNLLDVRTGGSGSDLKGLEFLSSSIAMNRILDCRFTYRGVPVASSMLNLSGKFLLPEGFERGVAITPKTAAEFKYRDVFDVLLSLGDGRTEEPQLIDLSKAGKQKVERASQDVTSMTRKEVRENRQHIELKKKQGYKFGI